MNDLLRRISDFCKDTKGSRLTVGRFFLSNLESVAIMTLEDISRQTGVSPSTVTRTASEIGFEGYHDFRRMVRDMVRRGMAPADRFKSTNLPNVTLGYKESLRVDQENLSRVLTMNGDQAIEEAIGVLCEVPRVFLAGSRSSYGSVSFLSFILAQIRAGVHMIREDEGRIAEQIMDLGAGDLLVAITLPRYSKLLVDLAEEGVARGCEILSVSDSPASPIAHLARVSLYVPYESFCFFNSCVCASALFNALATGVARKLGESALERLRLHNELLNRRGEVVTGRS